MALPLSHHTTQANGIKQHYVEAGSGPPVILLHGFPETWYAWRKQIPVLSERYRLIVPDLRGYGETEKPASGYDKRTMAADIRALMDHLKIERAAIIGHDRGARVATRFAKDHPDAISRLGVFDNIPTRTIFEAMDATIARGHWFFIFNQVPDLPEALIAGREEIWLRYILQGWTYDPEALTLEDLGAYVRAYQKPGAVRGALNDYRAGREDVAQDKEDADTRITCPTLALWGEDFELGGRMWDVVEIWRQMTTDLRTVSIPQCGHLPHEEQPDVVNNALLAFLDSWRG
ncbi:alpha/beta fold hydrolase [Rhodopila sp.]|uniref:alpha/beta fold hydrolase n=1 Tax=Rhodopila sp. TaxID=2480087 RepID=UPI003D0FB419